MNILEAKKLAKDTATENEIFGWKIFFTKDDFIGGTCWHDDHVIEVGTAWTLKNSKRVFKNLILHEIAHVFAGLAAHHGDAWKEKCVELGALPNEFMNDDMEHFPEFILPRESALFSFFKVPTLPTEMSEMISIERV